MLLDIKNNIRISFLRKEHSPKVDLQIITETFMYANIINFITQSSRILRTVRD